MERMDQLVCLVKMEKWDHQDNLVNQECKENQVAQGQRETRALQDEMVNLASMGHQARLEIQE